MHREFGRIVLREKASFFLLPYINGEKNEKKPHTWYSYFEEAVKLAAALEELFYMYMVVE